MHTRLDTSKLSATGRIPLVRILVGTIVAIVVAGILNVIIYYIGDAAGAFPDDFRFDPPVGEETGIGVGNVIFSTLTNLAIAGVVFAIISRFSRNPARIFWYVAIAIFLLSLLQPLSLADAPNDMVAFLIAMHVVSTIVVVAVFTRIAAMTPGASTAT